ncbi:hypothetical protein F5Y18DRAFT_438132 [Xylariaceae sp. FL1019]|nr:hypothetical protein F5Y18DRAFT_438132 [Xylariaceae sp. FL1019]
MNSPTASPIRMASASDFESHSLAYEEDRLLNLRVPAIVPQQEFEQMIRMREHCGQVTVYWYDDGQVHYESGILHRRCCLEFVSVEQKDGAIMLGNVNFCSSGDRILHDPLDPEDDLCCDFSRVSYPPGMAPDAAHAFTTAPEHGNDFAVASHNQTIVTRNAEYEERIAALEAAVIRLQEQSRSQQAEIAALRGQGPNGHHPYNRE